MCPLSDDPLAHPVVEPGPCPRRQLIYIATTWTGCVRLLIEIGASTQGITLSPDDPKPPSPEMAELLR